MRKQIRWPGKCGAASIRHDMVKWRRENANVDGGLPHLRVAERRQTHAEAKSRGAWCSVPGDAQTAAREARYRRCDGKMLAGSSGDVCAVAVAFAMRAAQRVQAYAAGGATAEKVVERWQVCMAVVA